MTLGFYENFPTTVHRIDSFNSTISSKQLQLKLIQVFFESNRKEFSFEEVTNPTVPHGKVIFEFGLAESEGFNYIDERRTQKNTKVSSKGTFAVDGFFLLNTLLQGYWRKENAVKVRLLCVKNHL